MGKTTKLGNNIKALMKAKLVNGKPVSANAIAQATGIPQSTITRILNGDVQDPRSRALIALANYFGVSVAELRDGLQAKMEGAAKPAAPVMQTFPAGDEQFVLAYVTGHEMELLTLYRSSNESGRSLIASTAKAIAAQSPTATPTA